MTADRTYELRCQSCDYQRTVPETDLHRVLSAVAGAEPMLSVTPLKSAWGSQCPEPPGAVEVQ